MDICSPTDLFGALRDIWDRHRAPRRLQGRTRYVIQRETDLQNSLSALNVTDATNSQSDSSATVNTFRTEGDPLSTAANATPAPHIALLQGNLHLLTPHPSTRANPNLRQTVAQALHHIKLAMRRDELSDLLCDIERYQNDNLLDRLVHTTASLHRRLDTVQFTLHLKPCSNTHGAQDLLRSPHNELHDLDRITQSNYVPLVEDIHSSTAPPVWGPAPIAEQLFADPVSHARFDIVLSVANAFAFAHSARWYHRRLCARDIVVNSQWLQSTIVAANTKPVTRYGLRSSGSATSSRGDLLLDVYSDNTSVSSSSSSLRPTTYPPSCNQYPLAPSNPVSIPSTRPPNVTPPPATPQLKILRYICPVTTGCFNTCAHCKNTLAEKTSKAPENVTATLRNHSENSVSFTSAIPDDVILSDGECTDRLSFASFILWIYSTRPLTPEFDPTTEADEQALSRVPWPLRFLVVDAKRISIHAAVAFLQALSERRINPHQLSAPLMSPPSDDADLENLLYDAAVRSALEGARTEEPEAALHLGRMWERKAILQQQHLQEISMMRVSSMHSDVTYEMICGSLRRAHACYEAAIRFGEPAGCYYMAALHAEWLDGSLPLPKEVEIGRRVSYDGLLQLLVEGAAARHEGALVALQQVWRVGLRRVKPLFVTTSVSSPSSPMKESNTTDGGVGGTEGEERGGMGRSPREIEGNGVGRRGGTRVSRRSSSSMLLDHTLLSSIVTIGKIFRGGRAGMPIDLDKAQEWFQLAHDRGYPDATLQLGLLHRQRARSAEELQLAVECVRRVACIERSRVGVLACYWLGYWNHHGLVYYADGVIGSAGCRRTKAVAGVHVVPVNNVEAVAYARVAAEGGLADGMVLFARMLREGVEGLEKDENEAKDWVDKARRLCNVSAHCAFAMRKSGEAREVMRDVKKREEEEMDAAKDGVSDSRGFHGRERERDEEDVPSSSRSLLSVSSAGTSEDGGGGGGGGGGVSGASGAFGGKKRKGFVLRKLKKQGSGDSGGGECTGGPNSSGAGGRGTPRCRQGTSAVASASGDGVSSPGRHKSGTLPTPRFTRKSVAKLLELAMNAVTTRPQELRDTDPVQALNPLPRYLAGFLALRDMDVWVWAMGREGEVGGVPSVPVQAMMKQKWREAYDSLVKAANWDTDERWRRLRVDYLDDDLDVIQLARDKVQQLNTEGRAPLVVSACE